MKQLFILVNYVIQFYLIYNMLTTLRNSSKNTILKFVLGTLLTVLIISFAMWGTEDLVGVSKRQNTSFCR